MYLAASLSCVLIQLNIGLYLTTMPIRNPFTRRPGAVVPADEGVYADREHNYPGFERVDIVGSKASSVLSVRSARSQDTGEYKMSGK